MLSYADPYARPGRWYKGNLHTHSTRSDGLLSPEDIIHVYQQRGYDFLALSDHNTGAEMVMPREPGSLVVISGFEFGHGEVDHMLCLGVDRVYGGSCQEALNATRALGGAAIICHPNWLREDYWSPMAIAALRYYAGIEVFNHVITRLPGRALATEEWDELLTDGHCLWGYANDDAHRPEDIGYAWNMVLSPTLSAGALLQHLEKGHCYGSTGLLFDDIGLRDGAIRVKLPREGKVRFVGPRGEILAQVAGLEASFSPSGEAYVRVEAENADGQAWSQPFWHLKS